MLDCNNIVSVVDRVVDATVCQTVKNDKDMYFNFTLMYPSRNWLIEWLARVPFCAYTSLLRPITMHFTHQPRMTLAQSGKCDRNAHCNHCSQNTGIALGSKLEHYTVTCNPKPRNTVSGPRLWQVALRDIQGLLAFGLPHATRCLSITTCKVRTLQKTVASPRTADSIPTQNFGIIIRPCAVVVLQRLCGTISLSPNKCWTITAESNLAFRHAGIIFVEWWI
jgi:hypothetical protein